MAQNPTQFISALNPKPFVTRYRSTIKYGAIAAGGIAALSWGYAVMSGSSRAHVKPVQIVSSAREMTWPEPPPPKPSPPPAPMYNPQPQQQVQQPKAPQQESEETKRRRAARRRADNAGARVSGFSFGEGAQVTPVSQGFDSSNQGTPGGNSLEIPSQWNQGRSAGGYRTARDRQWTAVRPIPPSSPYLLRIGTLIPAKLTKALDSDREGSFKALVTRDVMDSRTGQHVLIPSGSEVIGRVEGNFQGQAVLELAGDVLYFPDDSKLPLSDGPGVDTRGRKGLRDRVDSHFAQRYLPALGLSLITAGIRLGTYSRGGGGGLYYTPMDAGINGLSQELGQVAAMDLRQRLRIPPTVYVPEGYRFNLEISQEAVFDGPWQASGFVTDSVAMNGGYK
jgi:type IV secretory pathway VirB10-like protein